MMYTGEIDSAVGCFLKFEYLGEIKKEFENTLLCLSGAQMGSNPETNKGEQSRDTLLLSPPGAW